MHISYSISESGTHVFETDGSELNIDKDIPLRTPDIAFKELIDWVNESNN